MVRNRPRYRRIGLLDELRGLAAILMIFYHGAYDIVYVFGLEWGIFESPWMDALQKFIAITFILTSGVSSRLTRSNLKRGAVVFLCGMLMTGATYFFIPSQIIRFGVLHMLGASMIIYALLGWLLSKVPWLIGSLASVIMMIASSPVGMGHIGFGPMLLPLDAALYQNPWLFPLGIRAAGFFSSDYFPLLPWFFLFLLGTYIAVPIKEGGLPHFVYRTKLEPLAAVGKNTLPIYLLHQPALYALIWLSLRAADFISGMLAR